jgi:hypothetical protein
MDTHVLTDTETGETHIGTLDELLAEINDLVGTVTAAFVYRRYDGTPLAFATFVLEPAPAAFEITQEGN